jgi:hypothetical protein
MSRYRQLKIEGGAFFYTLALADWPFCSFHRYVAQGILRRLGRRRGRIIWTFVNEGVGTALRAFAHPTLYARWLSPNYDAAIASAWTTVISKFSIIHRVGGGVQAVAQQGPLGPFCFRREAQ